MRFHEGLDYEYMEEKHLFVTAPLSLLMIIYGSVHYFSAVDDIIQKAGNGTFFSILFSGIFAIFATIFSILYLSKYIFSFVDEFILKFSHTVRGDTYKADNLDIGKIFDNTLTNKHFYFTILSLSYLISVFMRYQLSIHHKGYSVSEFNMGYFLSYPKAFVFAFVGYCLFYTFANVLLSNLRNVLKKIEKNERIQLFSTWSSNTKCDLLKKFTFRLKERIVLSLMLTCILFASLSLILTLPQSFMYRLNFSVMCGVALFVLSYVFYSEKKVLKQEQKQTEKEKQLSVTPEEIIREMNDKVSFPSPVVLKRDAFNGEIADAVKEVNEQIQKIKPYRAFILQDDLHILDRMVERECKPMLHHFSGLPNEVQNEYYEKLMQQLSLMLAESERIYKFAYSYHENGFKKMYHLIENRYKHQA